MTDLPFYRRNDADVRPLNDTAAPPLEQARALLDRAASTTNGTAPVAWDQSLKLEAGLLALRDAQVGTGQALIALTTELTALRGELAVAAQDHLAERADLTAAVRELADAITDAGNEMGTAITDALSTIQTEVSYVGDALTPTRGWWWRRTAAIWSAWSLWRANRAERRAARADRKALETPAEDPERWRRVWQDAGEHLEKTDGQQDWQDLEADR